jgi:predicted nuclease of predicted toxin-antitoxin system
MLARFRDEARILVTPNKGFGTLAVVRCLPHSGTIRLVNIAARQQARVRLRVLELHGHELQLGAIVTPEPGRLRVRPSGDGS